jgi:predicted metal-dependent HD superfamily phosphohydrolase
MSDKPLSTRKTRGKAKPKTLTRKQKAFADYLLNNPKASATEAVKHTYNVKNQQTAGAVATENLHKPLIKSYLSKHTNLIEDTIIDVIAEYNSSNTSWQRQLAVNTAMWTHDKIHGKATQKVETTGVHIQMNIDSTDLESIS